MRMPMSVGVTVTCVIVCHDVAAAGYDPAGVSGGA
jgi:hypothetical protein